MDYILRPIEMSDAESFALHANNSKIADNLMDVFPHPYGIDDAKMFIQKVIDGNAGYVQVIEIEGVACGAVGLHPKSDIYRLNAEMGYWLAEKYWGQGIMTKVVRDMVRIGFDELEIERIVAVPFGTNKGSQRILEKVGFSLEATFYGTIIKGDKRHDEYIYAIRREHIR